VKGEEMRKITFGGANSLDNYIARKDEGVDWLRWGDEVTEIMTEYWKSVDTILMGRKTYEFAVRSSKAEKPNPYPGITSYVFSRTLKQVKDKTTTVVSHDAADFVRTLKNGKGKDICVMGGGDFARTLFEAGLIDEVGFNIHPVLLGAGIPLFHEMKQQIDLELIECRAFKNGCVYLKYRVKH
jgi:dihydrofolate reductase